MSTNENKDIVRRFYEEIWNRGNMKLVDELLSTDFVDHNPQMSGPGRENAKKLFAMYRTAFPDLRMTVEDQIAEGDEVVTRFSAHGTHRGELMGISPTGKHTSITGIDILRLAKGRIVEHWGEVDNLGLMTQLGVVPPPGKSTRH